MTLNPFDNLDLNEQQRAVLGALTNENCYLKLDIDGRYQLWHEEQALGYALSATEVANMVIAELLGKIETIKLTTAGKAWATQHVTV